VEIAAVHEVYQGTRHRAIRVVIHRIIAIIMGFVVSVPSAARRDCVVPSRAVPTLEVADTVIVAVAITFALQQAVTIGRRRGIPFVHDLSPFIRIIAIIVIFLVSIPGASRRNIGCPASAVPAHQSGLTMSVAIAFTFAFAQTASTRARGVRSVDIAAVHHRQSSPTQRAVVVTAELVVPPPLSIRISLPVLLQAVGPHLAVVGLVRVPMGVVPAGAIGPFPNIRLLLHPPDPDLMAVAGSNGRVPLSGAVDRR